MSNPFQNPLSENNIPQCSIHNLPEEIVNPDINDTQTQVFCANSPTKHQKVEDQTKENFQDIENECKSKVDMLNQFIQSINDFLKTITQSMNQIITLTKKQIDQIVENQTRQNELYVQSQFTSIDQIIQINYKQNSQFQEFSQLIIEQLKNLKQIFKTDKLIYDWQLNVSILTMNESNRKFQYSEVINSIEQEEQCYALAIKQNNSILAVGNGDNLRMLKFRNEKLKEIQLIKSYFYKKFKYLKFLKKSKKLFSVDQGGQKIFKLNHDNQFFQEQYLCDCYNVSTCQQINDDEDLIISGSLKIIEFWNFYQEDWIKVQSIQMENEVHTLSLNESGDKLIAAANQSKEIKVIEKDGNQWHVTQTIQQSNAIIKLCFINDNQFVAFLFLTSQLYIYTYDQKDNCFRLDQEIQFKNCIDQSSPMHYLKSKGILIFQNYEFIYIFRKQKNGEFILDQTIKFKSSKLEYCVSEDCLYLFTWDGHSKQIQIRRLQII